MMVAMPSSVTMTVPMRVVMVSADVRVVRRSSIVVRRIVRLHWTVSSPSMAAATEAQGLLGFVSGSLADVNPVVDAVPKAHADRTR